MIRLFALYIPRGRRRSHHRDHAHRLRASAFSGLALLLAFETGAEAASPVCTVSMPTMAFGSVSVLNGAAVDTTSTITVNCSGGSGGAGGERVCISIGAGSANDATSRLLTGPASNNARFDLYTDSARTTLWGSWQTGYDTAGVQLDVPHNGGASVTVYGRFFGSQQSLALGSYSSTFTANPFIRYDDIAGIACPTGTQTTSTSTSATATVVGNCNVSATTMDFGTTSLLTSNLDATATISAQCNVSMPYSIGMDNGSNASGSQRRMKQGAANFINYNLYTDSGRSSAWTSTTSTTSCTGGAGTCITGTGTGSTQTITVYGRVPPQTSQAPGTYTDTVLITFTF
ncbi:MAG TPA: spore coat U domain-containing protein [Bradyrhizobium sp.]|jgi:spore coat protein U-like protein|nr:spore coat U domain-containing protein [Bradyrhizobium sp.]